MGGSWELGLSSVLETRYNVAWPLIEWLLCWVAFFCWILVISGFSAAQLGFRVSESLNSEADFLVVKGQSYLEFFFAILEDVIISDTRRPAY